MKLDRIKQTLKKVNALVENLDEQSKTSTIEKDLLRRYLRDMYEDVVDVKSPLVSETNKVAPEASPVVPEPIAPEPIREVVAQPKPEANHKESAPAAAAPTNDQTTYYDANEVTTQPVVETSPVDSALPNTDINEFTDPVKYFPPEQETPAAAEKVEVAKDIQNPTVETMEVPVSVMTGRFEPIFSEKNATDLADQFQLQRITTIESAMGINQRMLTINELFNGDHKAFTDCIGLLNNAGSFATAKDILVNGPADKFGWDADSKLNLAADFVQLVRRKFS